MTMNNQSKQGSSQKPQSGSSAANIGSQQSANKTDLNKNSDVKKSSTGSTGSSNKY